MNALPSPTFSIVTATWNSIDTIADCLQSVAGQSWTDREHIVIDGASKDGTADYLRNHQAELASFVSEPDGGIYEALNKGITRSRGAIIGFLHADDAYAGNDILRIVADAFKDPSICAVYGDLQYVSKADSNHVVRHWKSSAATPTKLRLGWMPPHPTLFVKREWYDRIGSFDTRYRIAADYHSILQLFGQPGFKTLHIPRVLIRMRTGGVSNRSLRNIVRKTREDYDALRRSNFSWPAASLAIACKNLSKVGQFI